MIILYVSILTISLYIYLVCVFGLKIVHMLLPVCIETIFLEFQRPSSPGVKHIRAPLTPRMNRPR